MLYQIIFGWLHCYDVTLVKKCNKPLLQKSETKVITYKNLLKVSKKNNSGVSRINQIISKLLVLSKPLQFWTCGAFSRFTFHILKTTWGILLPGNSWNYMPPILVSSPAKRITTQSLVIGKLNREALFVTSSVPTRNCLFKVSNWNTRIRCQNCSRLGMQTLERCQ